MTASAFRASSSGPRRRQVFAGVLLLFGLVCFDRGFASWRNDPQTLPDINGHYSPGLSVRKEAQRRGAMLAGAGMVLAAALLVTREPL